MTNARELVRTAVLFCGYAATCLSNSCVLGQDVASPPAAGKESPEAAFGVAQRNAVDGSPSAQLDLAHYYRSGYGTVVDLNQAAIWYMASGLIQWSGRVYALTLGGDVLKDQQKLKEAYIAYYLASLAGAEQLSEKLDSLRAQLTGEQVEQATHEAEAIAREFGISPTQNSHGAAHQ